MTVGSQERLEFLGQQLPSESANSSIHRHAQGSSPRTLADRYGTRRAWQWHRLARVGVVLLADLDQVDGPRESRLVGVRRVRADDEHAPGVPVSGLGDAAGVDVDRGRGPRP
jgi:hypothetical protein